MSTEQGPIDASVLDLEKYNLPLLRTDIREILDLSTAVGDVIRRGTTFTFFVGFFVLAAFRGRMPIWALVPFLTLVAALLLLAALAISIFIVLRKRLQSADRAADRSLFTIAQMHGDLVELKADGGDVPLREIAGFLTHTVVFPMLIGTALDGAATAVGPVGWVSSRVTGRLLRAVESRVLTALEQAGGVETPVLTDAGVPIDGVADDVWTDDSIQAFPDEIRGFYEDVHRYLSRAVDGVEAITVGGAGLTTILATMPLIVVVVLGWLLT